MCVDYLTKKGKARVSARARASGASQVKPWMLYCSLNIPHPPFQTNETWLKRVNHALIAPPPWERPKAMHPADAYMSISKDVHLKFTKEDIIKVRLTYYAMV